MEFPALEKRFHTQEGQSPESRVQSPSLTCINVGLAVWSTPRDHRQWKEEVEDFFCFLFHSRGIYAQALDVLVHPTTQFFRFVSMKIHP